MQRVLLVVSCFFALGSSFRNETSSKLQCGPNEMPKCVFWCPPEKTCRTRGIAYRCKEDPNPCVEKCVCADGHYRNSIGECITNAECDQCNAPNEFYSCNSACDNECSTILKQSRKNCPIKNIVCNKWCYCDDGYARDKNRNCVLINECPARTSLSESETTSEWDLGRYRRSPEVPEVESTCEDPNAELKCVRSCPPETCIATVAKFKCDSKEPCKERCACKKDFYRLTDKSPCIPKCQCPQIANTEECRV